MAAILLLDDDAFVANAHARALRFAGVGPITVCTDPSGALERILRGERHDVVICDGEMVPGLGGVEFYRRAVTAWPELRSRIVFLSGGLSADDGRFVEDEGLPCFSKPLGVAERTTLIATLRRLVDAAA